MIDQEKNGPVTARSADAARLRRGRNKAILIVLLGICVLFYAITIAKMSHS